MAKRFTDTEKYKKPFIRGLQGAYKLLWDYLYHDCSNAGIWIVDFEIAQIYLGQDMQVNREDALKYFNKDEQRIIEIDQGKKWFIRPFVEFQYGELSPDNRAHKSVINQLSHYNLWKTDKGLVSPLQGRKDMDKDKDMNKEERGYGGKHESDELSFDQFWDLYDKKVGDKSKCEKRWNKLSKTEKEKIMSVLPSWLKQFNDKQFQPYPSSFLNQKRWNDEIKINGSKVERNAKPPAPSDFDNYDPYKDL